MGSLSGDGGGVTTVMSSLDDDGGVVSGDARSSLSGVSDGGVTSGDGGGVMNSTDERARGEESSVSGVILCLGTGRYWQ